jgi:hypothetical protein
MLNLQPKDWCHMKLVVASCLVEKGGKSAQGTDRVNSGDGDWA